MRLKIISIIVIILSIFSTSAIFASDTKVDFITQLPSELSVKILSYLPNQNSYAPLVAVRSVSTHWKNLTSEPSIWRAGCVMPKQAPQLPISMGAGQYVAHHYYERGVAMFELATSDEQKAQAFQLLVNAGMGGHPLAQIMIGQLALSGDNIDFVTHSTNSATLAAFYRQGIPPRDILTCGYEPVDRVYDELTNGMVYLTAPRQEQLKQDLQQFMETDGEIPQAISNLVTLLITLIDCKVYSYFDNYEGDEKALQKQILEQLVPRYLSGHIREIELFILILAIDAADSEIVSSFFNPETKLSDLHDTLLNSLIQSRPHCVQLHDELKDRHRYNMGKRADHPPIDLTTYLETNNCLSLLMPYMTAVNKYCDWQNYIEMILTCETQRPKYWPPLTQRDTLISCMYRRIGIAISMPSVESLILISNFFQREGRPIIFEPSNQVKITEIFTRRHNPALMANQFQIFFDQPLQSLLETCARDGYVSILDCIHYYLNVSNGFDIWGSYSSTSRTNPVVVVISGFCNNVIRVALELCQFLDRVEPLAAAQLRFNMLWHGWGGAKNQALAVDILIEAENLLTQGKISSHHTFIARLYNLFDTISNQGQILIDDQQAEYIYRSLQHGYQPHNYLNKLQELSTRSQVARDYLQLLQTQDPA